MKTKEQIESEIKELTRAIRVHYPPNDFNAQDFINDAKSRIDALQWVLEQD